MSFITHLTFAPKPVATWTGFCRSFRSARRFSLLPMCVIARVVAADCSDFVPPYR
jgi:hypothetical protein